MQKAHVIASSVLISSLVFSAFLGVSRPLSAETLTGGVAAANSTAEAANANPANGAFLDRSQIEYNPELYKSETLQVRYPGFDTTTDDTTGPGSFLSKPTFIYKVTPKFGIGGYALPPLPFAANIQKQRIPIVILGQPNFVDIQGSGKLAGAAQGILSYRFNNYFGFGINVSYQSVTFDAALTPSEGGQTLATVTGSQTNIDTTLGLRWEPLPGRLALGVAADLARYNKQELNIESSLLDSTGGGAGDNGTAGTNVVNPLNSVLFGAEVALSPRVRILADAEYTRTVKGGETYSLVELKKKEQDLYDTLAVRTGMILQMTDAGSALVGFRYEPSALGPGALGEGSKAGFGSLDLVQIFTGLDELRPYWELALGMQMGFDKHRLAKKGSDDRHDHHQTSQYYYAWTIGTGVAYRRASLGIDANGELPGAYLDTKVSIPLQLLYKF